jgi:hypothetical protein
MCVIAIGRLCLRFRAWRFLDLRGSSVVVKLARCPWEQFVQRGSVMLDEKCERGIYLYYALRSSRPESMALVDI